jgi:hypothetical protein
MSYSTAVFTSTLTPKVVKKIQIILVATISIFVLFKTSKTQKVVV